jgi:hypothetical protein
MIYIIIIIIIGLLSLVMKYNKSDTAKHDCKALMFPSSCIYNSLAGVYLLLGVFVQEGSNIAYGALFFLQHNITK